MVVLEKRKVKLSTKAPVEVLLPVSAGDTLHWKLSSDSQLKFDVSVLFVPSTAAVSANGSDAKVSGALSTTGPGSGGQRDELPATTPVATAAPAASVAPASSASPAASPASTSSSPSTATTGANAKTAGMPSGSRAIEKPRKEHILVATQSAVLGLAGEFGATHDGLVVLKMADASGRRTLSLFEALSATIVQLRHCTVDTSASRAQRCVAFHGQLQRVLQDLAAVPALPGGDGGAVHRALSKARDFHVPAARAAEAFLAVEASSLSSSSSSSSSSSTGAPPPPPRFFFPGFLQDKLRGDTHGVADDLDSAFGQLHTRVIRSGRSGDLLRV